MTDVEWDLSKLGKGLCPLCGAPLREFGPEDSCDGIQCSRCGFGAVTTNSNRRIPQNDKNAYSIWVDCNDSDRQHAIAVTANVLCIGVAESRRLIDRNEPIREGATAEEVIRVSRLFAARDVRIRIDPPFPWPLD